MRRKKNTENEVLEMFHLNIVEVDPTEEAAVGIRNVLSIAALALTSGAIANVIIVVFLAS